MRFKIAITALAAAGLTAAGAGPAAADPSEVHFLAPQVDILETNTRSCPGDDQVFTTKDGNGVDITWTYTNGNHPCVRVSYTAYPGVDCKFYFYVPAGHATGTIQPNAYGRGDFGGGNIYENDTDGDWVRFAGGTGLHTITFTDANTQGVGKYQLGWGTYAKHGVRQVCTG